jgi:homoserine kinase
MANASQQGVELSIEKGLALAGGLGGSAASAVAGAVAADALLGCGLTRDALFAAALEAETVVAGRHGDNVAPSLLGGAVLVVGLDPPKLGRIRVHPSIRLVLTTPDYQVATAKARAVLPAEIARDDAVGQASHLAALLLGLERGDAALIRGSLRDRIAEPARALLYPGYPEARAAGLEAGALGVAVSGAGPTLVAVVEVERAEAVARALEAAYAGVSQRARSQIAEVDREGARLDA